MRNYCNAVFEATFTDIETINSLMGEERIAPIYLYTMCVLVLDQAGCSGVKKPHGSLPCVQAHQKVRPRGLHAGRLRDALQ
jgi:hypothetical protein